MYLPLVEFVFVGEICAICFHSGLGRLSFKLSACSCSVHSLSGPSCMYVPV
jgi:hypothetical protein